MPEIRSVTIQPVQVPAITRVPEIRALPVAPPVTLELGFPIVELPGCAVVHPDANLNPSLLQDDPARIGAFCPEGQMPSFVPMDFTPSEIKVFEQSVPSQNNEDDEPETSDRPTIPKLPQPGATPQKTAEQKEPDKPFIEQAIDGLPPVGAVVTTTTIALVAATSALVAKPLADLILKLIKPTVKKTVKKVSQLRGQPVKVDSVRERVLAQRDRNRALMALRRALKP